MPQKEDNALWFRLQVTMLEGLLTDYEEGRRNAVYQDRQGKRVDETARIIQQLRQDIARLRGAAPAGAVRPAG
ncbi:hypothetical protein [Pararhodobacter sp. CCB-MM2]|uniref:hypothetical protein n=1 Tax=Pararhodobacter sp. CCB-MM2 TaxID=1786003 RepID=UPI00082BDF5E|nr:hypothetical protein [Pararhodobacter sp. CCB-MM2]MCA2012255.1 hypothetical protein [Cereibacter sphaeroides]